MAIRSGGGGGGDTGDSFLGQIDSMMGAPALQGGKGGKGKSGDGTFIQGLMQAIGIGNKKLGADGEAADATPPQSQQGAGGDTMGGQAAALATDSANVAKDAGGSTDLLKTIFSLVGGIL